MYACIYTGCSKAGHVQALSSMQPCIYMWIIFLVVAWLMNEFTVVWRALVASGGSGEVAPMVGAGDDEELDDRTIVPGTMLEPTHLRKAANKNGSCSRPTF
jgi:hypothetical protein